jgi:hypothetical protein
MFVPSIAQELRAKITSVFYDGRVLPKHTETQHFYQDVEDGKTYASVTTKTSILGNELYRQMAVNIAVEHIQSHATKLTSMEPEQITEVFTYAREAWRHNLNRAGNFGTHGHEMCDRYVKEWMKTGEMPTSMKQFITPEISNEGVCAGLSAELFYKTKTLFPIASEMRVLSKKYAYAGTLDALFLVGDVYKERVGDITCQHNWFEKGKDKISCITCGRQETLTLTMIDNKTSNSIYGRGDKGKHGYPMQLLAYGMAFKELTGIKIKRYWILQLDKYQPKYEVGVVVNHKLAFKCFLAANALSEYIHSREDPIVPLNKKQVITL